MIGISGESSDQNQRISRMLFKGIRNDCNAVLVSEIRGKRLIMWFDVSMVL
jgi:hypothetical protein